MKKIFFLIAFLFATANSFAQSSELPNQELLNSIPSSLNISFSSGLTDNRTPEEAARAMESDIKPGMLATFNNYTPPTYEAPQRKVSVDPRKAIKSRNPRKAIKSGKINPFQHAIEVSKKAPLANAIHTTGEYDQNTGFLKSKRK